VLKRGGRGLQLFNPHCKLDGTNTVAQFCCLEVNAYADCLGPQAVLALCTTGRMELWWI
jgi:hypothetical protein